MLLRSPEGISVQVIDHRNCGSLHLASHFTALVLMCFKQPEWYPFMGSVWRVLLLGPLAIQSLYFAILTDIRIVYLLHGSQIVLQFSLNRNGEIGNLAKLTRKIPLNTLRAMRQSWPLIAQALDRRTVFVRTLEGSSIDRLLRNLGFARDMNFSASIQTVSLSWLSFSFIRSGPATSGRINWATGHPCNLLRLTFEVET
jgi:hypothetical protein